MHDFQALAVPNIVRATNRAQTFLTVPVRAVWVARAARLVVRMKVASPSLMQV
jgi:hypothetical protein